MLARLRRPKERPAQWGSIMRKEAKEAGKFGSLLLPLLLLQQRLLLLIAHLVA